jgi:thiopurine S-methyltransferase
MAASKWDQRYRDGSDRWELGKPAPPLDTFLRTDTRAPQPPGRVLVPGCGRGHEAALLSELGYEALGMDFSSEAIQGAQALHGSDRAELRWLQADFFDGAHLLLRNLSSPAWRLSRHRGAVAGSVLVPPAAGFRQELWEPAQRSALERDNEWLGLFRKLAGPVPQSS